MNRHKRVERAVDDGVGLVVALLTNDEESFVGRWRFRNDFVEVVLPLVMVVRVMALFVDQSDLGRSGEDLLEELTLGMATAEGADDPAGLDAMRDGAALSLAWYRGDKDGTNALLAPYRTTGGLTLLAGVGNVVVQLVSGLADDADSQVEMVKIAGETVKSQLWSEFD